MDAGYDTEGDVAADTILFIPNREAVSILQQLRSRLRAIPGVQAVGFVHSTPLTGQWIVRDPFEVMEGPTRGVTPPVEGSFVAYDFFDVMRIPVIAGRTFSEEDLSRRDFPVIINDIAARRFFPGRNPVGERIHMTNRLREIIGVVGATRDLALDAPAEAQWYQPGLSGTSQLVVRASGVPNLPEVLRREITNTDPRFIVQRIQHLDDIVAGTVVERRLASRLVGVFATIAVLLAGVGLYGVLSFGVAQRRREFGIRAAIGANPARIVGLLMGQGLRTTAIGIGFGSVLSWFALKLLQPLLFDAQGFSVTPVAAAALLLTFAAIVAILGPALRAARTKPTVALTDL